MFSSFVFPNCRVSSFSGLNMPFCCTQMLCFLCPFTHWQALRVFSFWLGEDYGAAAISETLWVQVQHCDCWVIRHFYEDSSCRFPQYPHKCIHCWRWFPLTNTALFEIWWEESYRLSHTRERSLTQWEQKVVVGNIDLWLPLYNAWMFTIT